ncbi:hypothetical protein V8E54_009593 [Elaphomyces granulatus]
MLGLFRVKATLKNVLDDIASDEEDDTLSSADDRSPFPFTYDSRALTVTSVSPPFEYDVSKFDDQSTVAVEVALLGYQLTDKEPSYSLGMQGIYHLGTVAGDTPASGHTGKTQRWLPPYPKKAKGRPLRLRSVEAFLRYANIMAVVVYKAK